MKSTLRPYSSFTDPYLTRFYQSEKRLKELRKSGLINKVNQVYPENVYQANMKEIEKRETEAAVKINKDVQERIYRDHVDLHRQWVEEEKQKRQRLIASAKAERERSRPQSLQLPDVNQWTRQDFIMASYDYYPDRCRPDPRPIVDWFQLGRKSSGKGNIYEKNPYRDDWTTSMFPSNKKRVQSTKKVAMRKSPSTSGDESLIPGTSGPAASITDDDKLFPFFKNSAPLDLLDDDF